MSVLPLPSLLPVCGGNIAYSSYGTGAETIVLLPGLGDSRDTFRHLAPLLIQAGFRVVTVDLRGQGDSSATFDSYTAADVGADLVALLDHLACPPAIVLGNSLSAAAAVWAAAERPAAIRALILEGPFVRDVPVGCFTAAALKLLLSGPWGPAAWASYYKSLYISTPPEDLPVHAAALRASASRPDRMAVVRAFIAASKGPCEARLPRVACPVIVIMGSADPDFPDPAAEAALVAKATRGDVVMVPGAGHYPHAEAPATVAEAILRVARA